MGVGCRRKPTHHLQKVAFDKTGIAKSLAASTKKRATLVSSSFNIIIAFNYASKE